MRFRCRYAFVFVLFEFYWQFIGNVQRYNSFLFIHSFATCLQEQIQIQLKTRQDIIIHYSKATEVLGGRGVRKKTQHALNDNILGNDCTTRAYEINSIWYQPLLVYVVTEWNRMNVHATASYSLGKWNKVDTNTMVFMERVTF